MQTFNIKTWGCAICGYTQDCEPTQENADLHFNGDRAFALQDLGADECPSCALKGMRDHALTAISDPDKQMKMNVIDSQDDIDAKQAELDAEATRQVNAGSEVRLETDDEKAARVASEAGGDDDLYKELLALPNQKRSFPVMRDETPTERKIRIAEHVESMSVAAPEEITALRDQYAAVAP